MTAGNGLGEAARNQQSRGYPGNQGGAVRGSGKKLGACVGAEVLGSPSTTPHTAGLSTQREEMKSGPALHSKCGRREGKREAEGSGSL